MITPELKHLLSPDLAYGSKPPDPGNCCVALQALIGPQGVDSGESFQFLVVTPSFLAAQALPRWGRGMLIVQEFQWAVVDRMLERLLAGASRKSWREVGAALNHQLEWEFDGG